LRALNNSNERIRRDGHDRKRHTLRVDFAANRFAVLFNGKETVHCGDGTIQDVERVGVWTRTDSVTLFDDFNCSPVGA